MAGAIEQDEEAFFQSINWQTRYRDVNEKLQTKTKEFEEMEERYAYLEKINKQLAEQNSQIMLTNRIPVDDINDRTRGFGLKMDEDADSQTWSSSSKQKEQVDSLQLTLEELKIEKDWKTEYLKKEDELKKINTRYEKLTKYFIDLSLKIAVLQPENEKLKAKIKELEMDNEDGSKLQVEVKGAKRAEETENVADNVYTIFPSVFNNESNPNFSFVNPCNCGASCVLSVIYFVFYRMKLKICFTKFPVQMYVDLSEIPGATFKAGQCNLMLQDLCHLDLIDNIFLKENIIGIDQIDCALQEAITKMKEQVYPALLVVQYRTRPAGHCMALMHKTDDSNPKVRMEIYDVQKDKYWPKCDKHAKSIKEIAVYIVNKKVAEEWEDNCGVNICEAECLVCIPQPEVGDVNEL